MISLHTDQGTFDVLVALQEAKPHNRGKGDPAFNKFLARLNATKQLLVLAASTGRPIKNVSTVFYVHLAATEIGTAMVTDLFQKLQRQVRKDYMLHEQPEGVEVKPSAIQLRFNFYEQDEDWFEAVTIQCYGVWSSGKQNYLTNVLNSIK
jgi:hypothetical protein